MVAADRIMAALVTRTLGFYAADPSHEWITASALGVYTQP